MDFKQLFIFLKPYKNQIAIIIVFAVILAVIAFVSPFLSERLIDDGLVLLNVQTVVICAIIIVILSIGSRVIEYIQRRTEIDINNALNKDLKTKVFEHAFRLKPKYYKDQGFFNIVSNAIYDVGMMLSITDESFLILLVIICKIVGASVGLAILDWRLAILIAAMIPIKYGINIAIEKRAEKYGKDCMDKNKRYNQWLDDLLFGISDIKLLNLRSRKMEECSELIENINVSQKKLSLVRAKGELYSGSFESLFMNLLYIFGVYMIAGRSLTIGGLIAFVSFASYLLMPVNIVFTLRIILKEIKPSIESLNKFFSMEEEDYELEEKVPPDLQQIEFRNVGFEINDKEILKDISFVVNKGEKVVISGDNGSGKTTILNLLLRFYEPTEGQILFDGVPIDSFGIENYRDTFSVVSQDIHLFGGTIEDNICIKNKTDLSHLKREGMDFATDFISEREDGFETVIGANGARLSGGEKQKIALLRALNSDARILILDEATANYDKQSDAMFNDFIMNNHDFDFYIIVSHRKEILSYADKVINIE